MSEQNPYIAPNSDPGPGGEGNLDDTIDSAPLEEEDDDSEELREPASYVYANFLRRASAKAIDALCFNLVFFTVFGFIGGIKAFVFTSDTNQETENRLANELEEYQLPPEDETGGEQWARLRANESRAPSPGLSSRTITGIVIAAFMVVAGLAEWSSGQSLGKLLFGLQVVSVGPPALPSLGMAIGRNVGLIVDSMLLGALAYVVMLKSPRKQRSGDIAASTLVVFKNSIPGSPLSTPSAFIQGNLMGLLAIVVTAILLLMLDPTL